MAQHVRALRPERRDWSPDRRIFRGSVRVDEARVGNLTAGSRVDAVNLGVRKGFEGLWLRMEG